VRKPGSQQAAAGYVLYASSATLVMTLGGGVHRTLLEGSVFLYPPTAKTPKGKLRLMCETNPMSMVTEQAGGRAVAGAKRILEIDPETLHQRIPVILGREDEVDPVLSHPKWPSYTPGARLPDSPPSPSKDTSSKGRAAWTATSI